MTTERQRRPFSDLTALGTTNVTGVTRLVANSEFHRNLLGLVERCARSGE